MTKDDLKKFVEDNWDSIVKTACSFPFRELVDSVVNAAKAAGLQNEESLRNIARAAFDAAYEASEDLGISKAMELAQASGKFSTDSDNDYDALADIVMKELDDTKLEPYVNEDYEQFQ